MKMLDWKIPEAKDVIVGELAERGDWIVANIETTSGWPVHAQKVLYRGQTIWIMPLMKDRYPALAMKRPAGKSRDDCERLVLRFLSALAWVQGTGYLVGGVGGGSVPNPMGRMKDGGFSIMEEFDLSYLPEPESEKTLLAMALMREGRGLNHPGYSFLAFYRVVELAIGKDWKTQTGWINDQIAGGLTFPAREAVDKLRQQQVQDIGVHLYASGRCAMAHAKNDPIIDPDNPADARRLWAERPIMLALAERAIEEKLGVATRLTVYQKHLYELDGFKKIFGPELVGHFVRGEGVAGEPEINIPDIGVEIRGLPPYEPLASLTIKSLHHSGHIVHMRFASKNELAQFQFQLDFAEGRLKFDVFSDFGQHDDGSAESAEAIAEGSRFFKEYFGNGQLRIVDAKTRELISRKDAFIPVNMYQDADACDADIARWKRMAADRRDFASRFGDAILLYAQGYEVTVNGNKPLSLPVR
jgi:hypothetical protein